MGGYLSTTERERRQMLAEAGCASFDGLFEVVPQSLRLKGDLNIPAGLSELEVSQKLRAMAGRNKSYKTILRGAGAYSHYIPSIVKTVASKETFVTAYTPYQPEMSQGVLQAIFEYQTMICELTGMDASNASVYDGATAAAEAVTMCAERGREKVVVGGAINPETMETLRTYAFAFGVELAVVPHKDGLIDFEALKNAADDKTACVYIQQPNYFGLLEDASAIGEIAKAAGAKYVIGCNPISLGLIKTPADYGADIAVGEGQPLGLPLSFGGPCLGFMACRAALARKLPGRIVGETVDIEGRRGFVLTLQAREQHIRREKASSNICSNQALCALAAGAYLAAVGPGGLEKTAALCHAKAHYFASELLKIGGFSFTYGGKFFHEFVTNCPVDTAVVESALGERGILSGLPLGDSKMLWCVTETAAKADLDEAVEVVKEVCGR